MPHEQPWLDKDLPEPQLPPKKGLKMSNQIEKHMHLLHTGQYLELNIKIEPEANVVAGILMIKYDRNLTEYHPIDMSDIGLEYLNDIQARGVVVYNQDKKL